MNSELDLPSEDDLADLPKASIAVYALRSALRVRPFWTSCIKPTADYKAAVVVLNHEFDRLLHFESSTEYEAIASKVKNKLSEAAVNDNTAATVTAFTSATAAILSVLTAITQNTSSANVAFNASTAATGAAMTLGTDHSSIFKAPKKDYEHLAVLKAEITDASDMGPLGDLWHGSPPDWYIEAKALYDKTIAEWERELDEADNDRILSVYIDPGTSSPELITELYVALNALYRAHGGSGLEIVKEERRSMAGETV